MDIGDRKCEVNVGDRAWGMFFTGTGIKVLEGEIIAEFYGSFRLDTKELGILGVRPKFTFKSRGEAEVYLAMES